MPPKKKSEVKSSEGGGGGGGIFAVVGLLLVGLFVISSVSKKSPELSGAPQSDFLNLEYFFAQVLDFFQGSGGSVDGSGGFGLNSTAYTWYMTLLSLLSFFAVIILIYSLIRIFEIRKKEDNHLDNEIRVAMVAGDKKQKTDE